MTCKTHPDAPHGFVRGASHSEDRYVCECEFWEEPKMNERIRELAEQAGWDNHHSKFDTRIEKFAELIVGECADICLEANDHKNILRHFGVELDVNETLRNRSTYFGNDI